METQTKSGIKAPPALLKPTTIEHWRVLLAEFVHLLGLLLIHSRHAQSVRATSVLFDQMLHHLTVLKKMPGHEGTMMLNCSGPQNKGQAGVINYRILFGNLILQRAECGPDATPIDGKHAIYLNKALDQTFEYLSGYGIQSLYLQLPGESSEKIDQFHLALNIVARFQDAVKHQGAVTFHYGGRALAIPLICDPLNQPDFNLTLLAGINGLSAANANELMKQAKAFHDLALAANVERQQKYKVVKESYNQIFKVRSLRSQIVKPPVEVNNIPWICESGLIEGSVDTQTAIKDTTDREARSEAKSNREEKTHVLPLWDQSGAHQLPQATDTRQYLTAYFDGEDQQNISAMDDVIIDDYAPLETSAVAERLVAVTRMLFAIEKKSQDPAVVDHLLFFLQGRLLQVSEQVLASIELQRQGLKFFTQGRAMVVGLVHPRLMDLITLIKDEVVTRHKIAIIRNAAFDFDHQHADLVVDGFDISAEHAHHLLDIFKACFDADGSFKRDAFETRIDAMAHQADVFFEINWCFLKETPQRRDRLAFLNAIQLLMARLQDPKRALRFLLDDLCQYTARIDYTDRNAFVLANILMQVENKNLHVDLEGTPENVLLNARGIQGEVQRYALWRINTDNIRMALKVKTIHRALEQTFKDPEGDAQAADFLFALEREALIFLVLVNGTTARNIMRVMLEHYGNHQTEIYQRAIGNGRLAQMMVQLRIVVRCMGCVGYKEDIRKLKEVAESADGFCILDSNAAHLALVKQVLKQVADAIKLIQSHDR